MPILFSGLQTAVEATAIAAVDTSNILHNVGGAQSLGTSNAPFQSVATNTLRLGGLGGGTLSFVNSTLELRDSNAALVTIGSVFNTSNPTFTGTTTTKALTVNGDLVVNGSNFTSHAQTVTVADNMLVLNSGEVGTGVTAGTAGLRIDRGPLTTAYEMVFDEATDMFRVGMSNNMETLASQPYVTSALKSNALNPGCNLNDLVNAVDARSNLGSHDASNIIRGTLAVARGGTGTTTSTGSGSVVLSTSPALLGTATASNISASGSVSAASLAVTGTAVINNLTITNTGQELGAANTTLSCPSSVIIDVDANNNSTGDSFKVTSQGGSNLIFACVDNGNVGVGTSAPTQRLEVVGNVLASGSATAASFSGNGSNLTALNAANIATGTLAVARGGTGTTTNTGTGSVVLSAGATLTGTTTVSTLTGSTVVCDRLSVNTVQFANNLADKKLVLWDEVGLGYYGLGIASNVLMYNVIATSAAHVFTASNVEVMRVTGTGNVGMGTSTPAQKLHVVGNIFATGDVVAQSDARLKTDITVIDNAMARIGAISGYTYRMTGDETGRMCMGVLAQEVKAVMPEAVLSPPSADPDGFMSVAYGNLVALLIEGLKELGARVDRLEG